MPRTVRWMSISLVLLAMMTQFNNCGNYAEVAETNASASSVLCDEDCIVPVVENMSIKPILFSGSTQFNVPLAMSEFNIGGECNEGGYVNYNSIRWSLKRNGAIVRHSGMTGMVSSGGVHTKCINGRFLAYVSLVSISSDPTNRTGLRVANNSTTRSSYELELEIVGQDSLTGPEIRNPNGRITISLVPN